MITFAIKSQALITVWNKEVNNYNKIRMRKITAVENIQCNVISLTHDGKYGIVQL